MTHSLFLVRHAIAAEPGDAWPDDAKRPLTHKGVARMREVVAGLESLGVTLDLVLTSPLLRARHTADLLLDGLRPEPALAVTAALAPGARPIQVAEELGRHAKRERIALVGHEPALGELAAWLTGAKTPFSFKKGGVCRIDVAALPPTQTGQLIWLATPRMLRALSR